LTRAGHDLRPITGERPDEIACPHRRD